MDSVTPAPTLSTAVWGAIGETSVTCVALQIPADAAQYPQSVWPCSESPCVETTLTCIFYII